jgi:hypothetical protein
MRALCLALIFIIVCLTVMFQQSECEKSKILSQVFSRYILQFLVHYNTSYRSSNERGCMVSVVTVLLGSVSAIA